MSLRGASVVVVGGSSGMGLATARRAAQEGAEVVVIGRDRARLDAAAKEIGGGTRSFAADVSDEDAVAAAFAGLDHVDHVVSFAGEQPAAPLAETTHELFSTALDTRGWGAVVTCKHAVPKMGPAGSFTFTSGVSAHRPRPDRAAGAMATAALESFTRAMAVELAPIRVNALCPGAIRTPVLERFLGQQSEEHLAAFLRTVPLGRVGEPEEIADAVLFLMRNTYVTGITLRVDGGALLK